MNPLALLPVLADFIRLKDPCMLSLEVSGVVIKYPDIRSDLLILPIPPLSILAFLINKKMKYTSFVKYHRKCMQSTRRKYLQG